MAFICFIVFGMAAMIDDAHERGYTWHGYAICAIMATGDATKWGEWVIHMTVAGDKQQSVLRKARKHCTWSRHGEHNNPT